MPEPLETLLSDAGVTFMPVHRSERWRLEQAWREVYARNTHARTGRWQIPEFEWHVFSYGDSPHKSGAKAVELYRLESPSEWYAWSQPPNVPLYYCTGGSHLALLPLATDVYVFPPDLSWTMAFTHEYSMNLGPYFSRSEWQ
jgi:hypothetical protein